VKMNWIDILRLIVQIWPLIEKILEMIANAEQQEATTIKVEKAIVNLISGKTSANTPEEVVAALVAPLSIA